MVYHSVGSLEWGGVEPPSLLVGALNSVLVAVMLDEARLQLLEVGV